MIIGYWDVVPLLRYSVVGTIGEAGAPNEALVWIVVDFHHACSILIKSSTDAEKAVPEDLLKL